MQGRIVKVGVYLRRVQIAVAKHLLKRTRIDAVFQHKSSCGVPELVRRLAAPVKPRVKQLLIDHFLNAADAYPAVVAAYEERLFILVA